jgi:hypothetical protein
MNVVAILDSRRRQKGEHAFRPTPFFDFFLRKGDGSMYLDEEMKAKG